MKLSLLSVLSIAAVMNSVSAKCIKRPAPKTADAIDSPTLYAPAGSVYQGCFNDRNDRVFPNQFTVTAGDELDSCYKIAKDQKATFFGLQYGNQCFTGGYSTNITMYGANVADAQCDMPCGDPSLPKVPGPKMCGGGWLNSVYKIDGYKTLSEPVVSKRADYTYKGCYIDSSDRVLPSMTTVTGPDMIGSCHDYAVSHHATYFSMQYGSQCFIGGCDTNLETYGSKQSEDYCDYNCNADDGIDYIDGPKCGGFWRNSVYEVKTPVVQVAAKIHKEFAFKGCFIDTDIRLLPNQHSISGDDLTVACYKAAKANNDQFFGTQYGSQCFSGNKATVLTKYGKVDDSECNYACGEPNGRDFGTGPKCGASWRNSVYEIKA